MKFRYSGCAVQSFRPMSSDPDPALQALWLPFTEGQLPWPADGALFLGARDGWVMHQHDRPGPVCVQQARPAFDALQRSGMEVLHRIPDDTRWPLVLLLPPRQREAMRALYAQALGLLAPGGIIVASMPNAEGAKSGAADLARLAGPLHALSKHKCRVFWTGPLDGSHDDALAVDWRALGKPRALDLKVHGHPVSSQPGVFAWDRIDRASSLLAEHLPVDLSGEGA